eukprot:scaffold16301_cov71-Isochrysis_galbana.AAC.1
MGGLSLGGAVSLWVGGSIFSAGRACSSSAGGEAVISRDFAPVAPGPRTPPASEMTAAHSVWEWRRASSR